MKQLLIIVLIMAVNAIIAAIAKKQQEAKKKAAAEAVLRSGRPSPLPVPRELPDDPDEVLVNDDLFGDSGPPRLPPTSRTPRMQRPIAPSRPMAIPRPPLPAPQQVGAPARPVRAPRVLERASVRPGFAERQEARARESGIGARMRARRDERARREAQRQARQQARAKVMRDRALRISGKPAAERVALERLSPFAQAIRAVLGKSETARTGFLVGEILGRSSGLATRHEP